MRGEPLSAVSYSPDGSLLAVAGKEVSIYRGEDYAHPLKVTTFNKPVRSLAFSPDGRKLAAASENQTVQVWELW